MRCIRRTVVVCLVIASFSSGNVIACHGFRSRRVHACHVMRMESSCPPACRRTVDSEPDCCEPLTVFATDQIGETSESAMTEQAGSSVPQAPQSKTIEAPPEQPAEPMPPSSVTIRPLPPARQAPVVEPPKPAEEAPVVPAPTTELPEEPILPKPVVPEPKPMPAEEPEEPAKPARPAKPADEPTKPKDDDDLFDEPKPSRPAPKDPKPSNDIDDLFGDSKSASPSKQPTESDSEEASEPAAPQESAPEPKTEEPGESEADPFSILPTPDEPVRLWVDDTGSFEVTGRLVSISPTAARILKSNGRHTTVPFERLSEHDQFYVEATAMRIAGTTAPPADRTAGL